VGKSGTFQCAGINYKRASLLCVNNSTIESPHKPQTYIMGKFTDDLSYSLLKSSVTYCIKWLNTELEKWTRASENFANKSLDNILMITSL
jgi:hypothetical protein